MKLFDLIGAVIALAIVAYASTPRLLSDADLAAVTGAGCRNERQVACPAAAGGPGCAADNQVWRCAGVGNGDCRNAPNNGCVVNGCVTTRHQMCLQVAGEEPGLPEPS